MTDKTTLEQLFRQHYRTLFQLAMTLLHDEAESQDVVSEVFARLMSDGSLLPDEREESYLLAAVRNRCLNVVRNRSIQQRIQKLYLMEQEMATKSPARLIEEAFDLLHQLSPTDYIVNAQGRTETYYRSLPHYLMLHAVWHFNKNPKKK